MSAETDRTPLMHTPVRGNGGGRLPEVDNSIWSAWNRFKPLIAADLPSADYKDVHDLLRELDDGFVLYAMVREVYRHAKPGKRLETVPTSLNEESKNGRWSRAQAMLLELHSEAADVLDRAQVKAYKHNREAIARFFARLVELRFGDPDISFRSPGGRHTRAAAPPSTPGTQAAATRYGGSVATPRGTVRSLAAPPLYAAVAAGVAPPVSATPARPPSQSVSGDVGSAGGEGGISGIAKGLKSMLFGGSEDTVKIQQLQEKVSQLLVEREARDERVRSVTCAARVSEEELKKARVRIEELEAMVEILTQLKANYASTNSELQQAQTEIAEAKATYDANLEEATQKLKAAREESERYVAEIAQLEASIADAREQLATAEQQHASNLREMEAEHAAKDEARQEQIRAHEQAKAMVMEQLELMRAEARAQADVIAQLEESVRDAQAARASADAARETTIAEFESRSATLAQQQAERDAKLAQTLGVVSSFGASVRALRADMANALCQAQQEFAAAGRELVARVAEAERLTADANTRYAKEQAERRRLFNKLQEARGNIRVLARVRPLLQKETESGELAVAKAMSPYELVVNEMASDRAGGRLLDSKSFEFDHVFGAESTQQDVFDEVVPLVTSAMDGFHACIFAYGQTGSGKTFTMGGAPGNAGVYRRSLEEMFSLREERASSYKYSIKVSMVEIYNENVMDLLADPVGRSSSSMDDDGAASLEIKQGPNGNFLPDVTIMEVGSVTDVESIMAKGALNRTVGRTNANEHSSRSHSLLMIDIYGHNVVADSRTYGRLVLVDLAGSERVSKSGAEGQRLKEAQNINKSLSALGDVIQALAHKAPHVPFRNSNLGKENKTLMIVQVSPVVSSRQETLCSLNFASRVRRVELGKASKHADSGDLAKLKAEVKRLQDAQRTQVTETAALHEAARAAEEAEAAAKAKLAEAHARISKLEVDAVTREEAAKEVEKLRAEVSKLTTGFHEKSAQAEKLQAELKEAAKSSKTAASAAADATTARMEAAVKRAIEDTEARMKIERSKAVAELEAKFKVDITALRKALKEAQAAESKSKAELLAADAKAKADINSALAAAKASWDREARRATISQARAQRQSSAAFARKMSLRKSTAPMLAPDADAPAHEGDAAVASMEADDAEFNRVGDAEDLNASMVSYATSAVGETSFDGDIPADGVDRSAIIDAEPDAGNVFNGDVDVGVDADMSMPQSLDSIDAAVEVIEDDMPVASEEVAVENADVAEIADIVVHDIAPESCAAAVATESEMSVSTPTQVEAPSAPRHATPFQAGAAEDFSGEQEQTDVVPQAEEPAPAVALFGRLEEETVSEKPVEPEAGASKMGSRERARMLGLASPKPVGILKARSATAKSARVALLSPHTSTVMIPGAATPGAPRRKEETAASGAAPTPKRHGPPTPGRINRRAEAAVEDAENMPTGADARAVGSFMSGGIAAGGIRSTSAGSSRSGPASTSARAGTASGASSRSTSARSLTSQARAAAAESSIPIRAPSATSSTASDPVDGPDSSTTPTTTEGVLRSASSAANVLAGMKAPAGMKLMAKPAAASGSSGSSRSIGIHGGAARVKAPAVKVAPAAVRGPTRVSVYEASSSLRETDSRKDSWRH